jgi:hypothetical protein
MQSRQELPQYPKHDKRNKRHGALMIWLRPMVDALDKLGDKFLGMNPWACLLSALLSLPLVPERRICGRKRPATWHISCFDMSNGEWRCY